MAGKNQPPNKARVVIYTTRAKAAEIRRKRERAREQQRAAVGKR